MVVVSGSNSSVLQMSGYVCGLCGGWITQGLTHDCSGTSLRQCTMCGQWVFGKSLHICNYTERFYPPVAACQHCYCIDVPPSGERTKEHYKCCHCGDTRVKP